MSSNHTLRLQPQILNLLILVMVLCLIADLPAAAPDERQSTSPEPWTVEEASLWYDSQPWLVGCNFLPSSAVNDIEMWQRDTFDTQTIDREFGWAAELGFNSVRVFVNYVVWQDDSAGLKQRFTQLLETAAKHGISVMPVLLDDCNFAGREAKAGPQPEPVPGVHNSQWVSSPPLHMVTDRDSWPRLEEYVRDMVGTFGQDRRVIVWDLYNEPGNSSMGEKSLPLVEAAFRWARQASPVQPLTIGVWADFDGAMSKRIFELSDVVSFHGYDDPAGVRAKIERCAALGRPVFCTEWLRRQTGNDFENLLPVFDRDRVGCYHWGLVAGRTQTFYPWGSPQGAPEPATWQHDLLRRDGSPFRAAEIRFIKSFFGRSPTLDVKEVVPTARGQAVTWRYTLEEPAGGWFESQFDDSQWAKGAAPFGRNEPPIGRAPRTEWTTSNIWLRRQFEWPEGDFQTPRFVMHFDEEPEVYLNGVLAARCEKWSDQYQQVDISPQARATLKSGRNTLAVHCRQSWGGQFIDVGITIPVTTQEPADEESRRWTVDRAWRWYDAQPWPCGFNYVPANAISYTEMWMDYCFDPDLIDRELQLAEKIGFNCVRVVLPFVVWEAEPDAFKKRLDEFAHICQRRGIRVMFALFDDCVFGPIQDPVFGRQPEAVEGWYANGWTPSPGHGMVRDPSSWPRLEKYVKDVITTFRDDSRVWVWDLYNEPTNGGLGDVSLPLVERVFKWARDVDPSQPLTVGQFSGNERLNEILYRQSDVITFHDYGGPESLTRHMANLKRYGRPMICTEWLNRGRGSTVAPCLPIFRRDRVGCLHWGLVNGKTQTDLNWGHRPGQPDPPVWQHDIFRPDHTPYDEEEIERFRRVFMGDPGYWQRHGAPSQGQTAKESQHEDA